KDLHEAIVKSRATHYGEEIHRRLAAAREALDKAIEIWRLQREGKVASIRRARFWKKKAKLQVKRARKEWRTAVRLLERLEQAA
ncbi:MAG TPA: hypothetical protein VGF40_06950, partial [Thermoanaerobaculia bacterium]